MSRSHDSDHPPRSDGIRSPETGLRRLAGAYQVSRAVQVAARLGLGGLVAGGPRTVTELARETGSDRRALRKLLRFLADLRVVEEHPGDAYGPTSLSDRLDRIDNLMLGEESWSAWGALPEALRTGRPVFREIYGASFFEYAAAHPEQGRRWHDEQTRTARWLAPSVAEGLGRSGSETVVDVGGGDGTLLAEILRRAPGCRGVLLDLPEAVAPAGEVLRRNGVAERCRVVAGDAFDEVPAGDVLLLCRVLFNWSDERALTLLGRCRDALEPDGRLVIVEILMPDAGEPRAPGIAAADLHHFLLWGGSYRTRDQIERLLEDSGFAVPSPPVPIGPGAEAATVWRRLEARPA
ncbi:MAG: methyltransferase [Acidobacteriota bacterium]|jgi:SAM-dependent methyltransferase